MVTNTGQTTSTMSISTVKTDWKHKSQFYMLKAVVFMIAAKLMFK